MLGTLIIITAICLVVAAVKSDRIIGAIILVTLVGGPTGLIAAGAIMLILAVVGIKAL